MKVKTLHKQQNSHIRLQSNAQTTLDLRNATVGYGFHFKHRNKTKELRGLWSASELYRLSDRHLSTKFSANFLRIEGRRVVSAADPLRSLISVSLTGAAIFLSSSSSFTTLNTERFQSKVLRTIVDTPWYVPNTVIRRVLQTPTVREEIRHYSSQCSARLSVHPNDLVVNLMAQPNMRLQSAYQIHSLILVFRD
jgi:hypothetical protein